MYAVEFNNFSWKYLGSSNWVLRNINLKISKGEFIGIMGPSGAGKTTLALSINGLIPKRIAGYLKGEVRVLGNSTTQAELYELTRKVGVVFQDPEAQFISMKVRNELAFGLENYGIPPNEIEERINDVAEVLGICNLLEKSPTELSGGQKQRVAIASVLVMRPEIIVLDEPVSDLDPIGKEQVYETISVLRKESGATIIVIDHEVEYLLRNADRLILLRDGEIILDLPPDEFVERVELVEECGETVPEVSKLIHMLKKKGKWSHKIPITVDELISRKEEILNSLILDRVNSDNVSSQVCFGSELIEVEKVSFIYPDGTEALSNISLTVREGEFLAIVGANGSGKTTLAKHLNGLLTPTSGRLKVCGIEVPGPKTKDLSRYVGYVFQNPDHQLFCRTVYEELLFSPLQMGFSKKEAEEIADMVLKQLNLTPWRDEHPFFLGKGQRRRLAVGAVLTIKPRILIVDEPTTGQDWTGSVDMMNLLKRLNIENKITTIIITHEMKVVTRYCNRVIAMRDGKILYDGDVRKFFGNLDLVEQSGVKPTQITHLFSTMLRDIGKIPLTVEECMGMIDP